MKAATFDQKVENAAAIVLGKAVKKESRWDAEHRFILTYTTFRIEKSIKGLTGQQEVTVVTPGGVVGDVHQDTVGIPEFREGAEHVLFLRNTESGPTVLFFDQGAYDVETERGQKIVKPVASDAVTIDTQRGVAVTPEEPRTLERFERDVREAENRVLVNRMEMLRKQRAAEQPSLWTTIARNKFLIALALIGIALATWQVIRRA